jgi:hypothetical protein
LLLIIAQSVSLFGAPKVTLGILDIIYNIKFFLIYFFLVNKLKRHHFKWIIIIFLFAIVLESNLAIYERLTGNVGIGRTKGNTEVDWFAEQHEVGGGFEDIRAEGTTDNSHTLALYYAFLLPIPLVLITANFLKTRVRLFLSAVFLIGLGGLIVTFSRSGWLSFLIAACFALFIVAFKWKKVNVIFIAISLFIVTSMVYPKAYEHAIVRLIESPSEIITHRFEMNWTALDIWKQNFLFGYGAANYMQAVVDPDINVIGKDHVPVHNAFLLIASETGLVGVFSFFGIIFVAMFNCYKVIKCDDAFLRLFALGILTGFIGYLLDGVTDPLFRQEIVYAQLWTYIAISLSFERILKFQKNYSTALT